jgi:hypothetical protein
MPGVTISLKAAGLTHAAGKSDKCDGEHDVSLTAVTGLDDPGWTDTGKLPGIFQLLHAQAHPDGAAYWDNCTLPGCAEAYDLLNKGT